MAFQNPLGQLRKVTVATRLDRARYGCGRLRELALATSRMSKSPLSRGQLVRAQYTLICYY